MTQLAENKELVREFFPRLRRRRPSALNMVSPLSGGRHHAAVLMKSPGRCGLRLAPPIYWDAKSIDRGPYVTQPAERFGQKDKDVELTGVARVTNDGTTARTDR